MIKLSRILLELLDTSTAETYQLLTPGTKTPSAGVDMEPKVSKHSFSDGTQESEYFWAFKNAKGNKMDITLTLQREADGNKPVLTLSFGNVSRSGDKYHSTTGAGDLKAILATVIKAADKLIEKENIGGRNGLYAISYAPSDDRRDRIYRYFISTYFPNFEMKKEGVVYQMFINKNYKGLSEVDVSSTGTWEDVDMGEIDPKTMEEIFQLYKATYEAEGLDLSVYSAADMSSDYKALKMQDVDGDLQADCFIVYKPVPGYGKRIALLFTNKKPGSGRETITKVVQLCKTRGWFLEASKKMEDIMSKSGAPVIEDEETIKGIIGPRKAESVKFLGDGYYERVLGTSDKRIVKRLYGSTQ